MAELKAARQDWGVWADGIRGQAGQRLAVSDLRDARVMDDLEYARALDMGALYIRAVNAGGAEGGPVVAVTGPEITDHRVLVSCHGTQMGSPHPDRARDREVNRVHW